jgi:hypothetical protein
MEDLDVLRLRHPDEDKSTLRMRRLGLRYGWFPI